MKQEQDVSKDGQEKWRDFIQSEIDADSKQRGKDGMANPKKPHIKYLWDEERMQWYRDMKAYRKQYYET